MPNTPRHAVLMCPPTHFSVDYEINPWMRGQRDGVDRVRALRQWEALRAQVEAVADVRLLAPAQGLPDMVFTANAGLVHGDVVVPSRFVHPERAGEEAHFIDWFARHGFRVQTLGELPFEGAGDALFDRAGDWLWLGHGHRSRIDAGPALQALLGVEVVPLRLVDPRFYHLDTCLCPLDGGHLLYFPPAFDAAAQAEIRRRVPSQRRIEVDAADAAAFACNAVGLGERVLLSRASPALRQRLQAAGYQVCEVPLDEFLKAGGAAKCLTLRLDEPVSVQAAVPGADAPLAQRSAA